MSVLSAYCRTVLVLRNFSSRGRVYRHLVCTETKGRRDVESWCRCRCRCRRRNLQHWPEIHARTSGRQRTPHPPFWLSPVPLLRDTSLTRGLSCRCVTLFLPLHKTLFGANGPIICRLRGPFYLYRLFYLFKWTDFHIIYHSVCCCL